MSDSPIPPPSPSPSPDEAASSAGSPKGSGSSFIADPGPAFDERAEPVEAPPLAALPVPPPGWEESQVATILEAKGQVLHNVVAVDKESDEWIYTQKELRTIAPPLTRILNRYDATRAAAGTGDELAVIIGLSGYTLRSYKERRHALAVLAGDADEPIVEGIDEGVAPTPPPGDEIAWEVGS